jgi:tRNA (guanine26-N2/guanine27-N2)-dimethyltransferase
MHEIGVRILVRKCQVIAHQYDKTLLPLLSYATDHYFRLYLQARRGRKNCDATAKMHGYIRYCLTCHAQEQTTENASAICPHCKGSMHTAGPLWLGSLWDKGLVQGLATENTLPLLQTIAQEAIVETIGFFDIPSITKSLGIGSIAFTDILAQAQPYLISRTHFASQGLRTTMPIEKLRTLLKEKDKKKTH